jgi:TPR repeat protein
MGSLLHKGDGIPQDDVLAVTLFRQSCASGWWRGCGRLGESYLWGEGAPVDPVKAIESFEKACNGRYALSCMNAATMYRRGIGTQKDEMLAQERVERACELGLLSACQHGEAPVASIPASHPEASGRGSLEPASRSF